MRHEYFVVYHKETTKLLRVLVQRSGWQSPIYPSMGQAKAALTRAVNKGLVKREDYAIAEADAFYKTIEKKETRHGIAACEGKEYVVGVNEPWTTGPWSETYWST